MVTSTPEAFSPLRSLFWPIHNAEWRKFLPMLGMLFLICFCYGILRNAKDTVLITATGAEVLPFVKVWGVLPTALLLTFGFTVLSNLFSQERVFYLILSSFLVFYLLFAFILYPLGEALQLDTIADFLTAHLPLGAYGLIAMLRYWSLTLFYVLSEVWGSLVLNVLFWAFANEVTQLAEARRFYSILSIGSNMATIAAGSVGLFLSQKGALSPFLGDHFETSLRIQILIVVASGLLVMMLFRWLNRNVLNEPTYTAFHSTTKRPNKKNRLSIKDSFSYLSNSKYLLCIAIMVLSYNLVINLVEVVWKDQLYHLYPKSSDFNYFLSSVTIAMGVVSTVTALFMAWIIKTFGWTKTALITPVAMLITSMGFFFFYLFQGQMEGIVSALLGTSPLMIAVYFGGVQNCISKAAKYSVFDATKEMAFIPLPRESKLKGKAAIDGVGSRLGKSGGSLIHQSLLMVFGSLSFSAPYVAVILFAVILLWIASTRMLGVQFGELVAQHDNQLKPNEEGTQAQPQPQPQPAF